MADEAEQGKIVRHFLLNSPPAQFSNVERDLRTLLEGSDVVDRVLPRACKRYNEDQMLVVTVPESDTKLLITKPGNVKEDEYLEPKSNTVIRYDHSKREAIGKRDAEEGEGTPGAVAEFRTKVGEMLQEYVDNFYPAGVSVVYINNEEGAFKLTACISATKANLSNRWSGRLRATYTCQFTPGDSSVSVEGNLTLKVHYFEDGNVQLNSAHPSSLSCSASDPDTLASTLVKAIEENEKSFHSGMELGFVELSQNTFKQLRRKLPVSGTRFNFDNWASYSIGGEMGGNK